MKSYQFICTFADGRTTTVVSSTPISKEEAKRRAEAATGKAAMSVVHVVERRS